MKPNARLVFRQSFTDPGMGVVDVWSHQRHITSRVYPLGDDKALEMVLQDLRLWCARVGYYFQGDEGE